MFLVIQKLGENSDVTWEVQATAGETVTLGSGDVDIELSQYAGLPRLCAVLSVEKKQCFLRNVSESGTVTVHNGQPVFGKVRLWHGDLIVVGRDQFRIVARETPQAIDDGNSGRHDNTDPDADESGEFQQVSINPAVVAHFATDSYWSDTTLLYQLHQHHGAFFFANFRHTNLTVPDWVGSSDLLQGYPQEVREVCSLHPVRNDSFPLMLETFTRLQQSDAAVWVVPESTMNDCLEGARFHLAWFARASILEQTLAQSPSEFGQELLKPFKAICLKSQSGISDWVINAKAGFNIAELGLSRPDSGMPTEVQT